MYINITNITNIQNTKKIIKKRQKWISLDTNTNFRNMLNTLKYLESLPIKKHTYKNISNSNSNTNNNNNNKLTKKNII